MKHDRSIQAQGEAPADLKAQYYAAAASWADDTGARDRRSRKLAWTVAGGACAIAIAQALALAALLPLKTVKPYTILVDRRDGTAELAQGVKLGPLAEDKALTQSFLVQYVLARETWDRADMVDRFRRVVLWSTDPARTDFTREYDRNDPKSAIRTTPPHTVTTVAVRSATLLSRDTALVRFETRSGDDGSPSGGAATGPATPVSAVITFRYTPRPLKPEDRYLNPLGFQVVRYRREMEAATPPAPATEPASELGTVDARPPA